MRKSDFDVWFYKFKPVERDKDNILWETYGDDYEIVTNTLPDRIWTLVDCNGKCYIIPGWHYVNRMNYFITEKPWKDGQRDYKYC